MYESVCSAWRDVSLQVLASYVFVDLWNKRWLLTLQVGLRRLLKTQLIDRIEKREEPCLEAS